MPKRAPDPILDVTDWETEELLGLDEDIDELVEDARISVAGHPDFRHLDPDVRIKGTPEKPYVAKRPADVMKKALLTTTAGQDMSERTRRKIIKAMLIGLREESIDLVTEDEQARRRTETNAQLLMIASGWYVLRDGAPFFRTAMRSTWVAAAAQSKAAPQLAYVYDKPIPEEAEEEPDVDAMLALMGNLPPLGRPGH
ncbi:hypothetical protein FV226_11490 [Methylobacterium sp. WL12]|uniref:hypothetical protein n=1 Tax=Methylobacterium sp. WL12 TaxID=2603890 RepID=UPI0011CC920F|nr:hypothetical protein [Methylobacterium sp. WL12]TXM72644.1 hypothetical protein FV226_11490 [Methylobacterium sp. WL12]